jgi:hypothetical protein
MVSLRSILESILTFVRVLFQTLKFTSVEMILFENKVIKDNYTKAHICQVTHHNVSDICEYEGKKYLKKYKRFLERGDLGYYAYLGYTLPKSTLLNAFREIAVKPFCGS